MKRIVLATIAMVIAVSFSAPAVLAGSDSGPKLALHLTPVVAKSSFICAENSPNTLGIPCSNYVVNGLTRPTITVNQLIYLVVAQVDTPSFSSPDLAGATLGIQYNGNTGQGVDMVSWTLCADGLEFKNAGPRGDWPASGGGNVITFTTCQQTRVGTDGVHAVLGAFTIYAYGNDIFRVTPNRNFIGPDVLLLADCSSAQTEIDTTGVTTGVAPTGWVGFGNCQGCNPCVADCRPVPNCSQPVKPATWGSIKHKY